MWRTFRYIPVMDTENVTKELIERVKHKRAALIERLRDLEPQVADARAELADIEGFLRVAERLVSEKMLNQRRATPLVPLRIAQHLNRLPKVRMVKDQTFELLLRVGRPMKTPEIFASLKASGFAQLLVGESESHQIARLSSMLSEDPRFEANRALGWSLTSDAQILARNDRDRGPEM